MNEARAELTGERIALVGRFDRLPATRLAREIALRGGAATRRIGARCTGLVIGHGAVSMIGDGRLADLLSRARRWQVRVEGEGGFLRRLGLATAPPAENRPFSSDELAAQAGIEPAIIETLHLFDLVDEAAGRHGFRDLIAARQVAALLGSGAALHAIIAAAVELRQQAPEPHPLARERLVRNDDGRLGLRVAGQVADLSGQLRLALGDADAVPPLDLLLAAEAAADEGRESDAIAWYRRYVAVAPDDAIAQFNLAALCAAGGDREEAQHRLMAAIRLDPRFAEAWYNLAHLAEQAGRAETAMRHLDRALAIDPGYADALYNRARLALATADFARAAELYQRYVTADPDSEWSRRARRAAHYSRLMLREGATGGGAP
jgi:tetratricopeptide (TPR) repeat protein